MAAADPLNLYEFEALARSRMEPGACDYFAGGAADESTLGENPRRRGELELAMVLAGCPRVSDIDASLVARSTSG